MAARTYHTVWHGMGGWALESDALRVIILPELGAKLASIFDKRAQHEWLVDPGKRPVCPVPYGATFIEQDMCGWDEMFPTIKPCVYPAPGPYQGRALPDHGEVWALCWRQDDAPPGTLAFSVAGQALPYRFSRLAQLIEPDTLLLNYRAVNTGDHDLACLWAAHPQFTVSPATELILPSPVTSITNVRAETSLGAVGQRHPWPLTETVDGKPLHLNRIGPARRKDCRKFYVSPEFRIGWAALYKPESDNWLRMAWQPDDVPYLGVWVDEGAVNPEATIALEISTGYHDSLVTAWENQRLAVLSPGCTATWQITICVGTSNLPLSD